MSQSWNPPPPPSAAGTVPNNLILSIIAAVISFIFCCLPHGLLAVYFATQVDKKAAAGDLAGAESAAKNAKLWAIVSIAVAVLGLILSFAFGVLGGIMSSM